MDVAIFIGTLSLGTFIGLICKKNNYELIPK
jgi:hypothetical protein